MANLIGSAPNQVPTNQMLGKMAFEDNTNYLQKVDGAMGYPKGMGGSVTQLTSKSTTVTLNAPCGQITMNNTALAAGATVVFKVMNTFVTTSDAIIVTVQNLLYTYNAFPGSIGFGEFYIKVTNTSPGSLSESVVINFFILKGQLS